MSNLTVAVERLWDRIAKIHPDVPPVVVTIAAGKEDANGHYSSARWNHGGARLSELFLSGESLKRGAKATLVTVVHEAAHGANDTRRTGPKDNDTSRQGRYHNTKFKVTAEEFGLEVRKDEKSGWLTSGCEATEELCKKYKKELERLEAALEDFYRLSDRELMGLGEEGEEGEAKESSTVAAVCQCANTVKGIKEVPGPRRIRISRNVLAMGGIACELCGSLFEEETSS
jgi:hypothetical protein